MTRQVVAHHHVIEAIRARDPDEARNWMRRHIDDFRRGYVLAGLPLNEPIAGAVTRWSIWAAIMTDQSTTETADV